MVEERERDRNYPSMATDLIAGGAEIVAMEHDQARKFSLMQRRNVSVAMEMALAELRAFPEDAAKGFYTIPRKSKKCKHRSGQTCKECIRIEGASVGAARVVARNWGNCTVGVRIIDETNDHWDLEGRFLDFESNYSPTRGLRILKRVKWAGKVIHVSELDPNVELQIFQAGVSKCFRNVVRDGVPEAMLDRYWRTAKELSAGKQPGKKLSKKAVKKILDAFGKFRATPAMLEERVGKTMDQWTGNDAVDLKGLFTALDAGEVQVSQVFGGEVQEPEPLESGEMSEDEKAAIEADEADEATTKDAPNGTKGLF